MKRHLTLLLVLCASLLAAVACDSGPRQRIASDRMALVVKDLQLAHQYVASQQWSNGRKDTIGAQLYAEVLRRHEVTREELLETLDYLAQNPTDFERILNLGIDSANVQLSRRNQQAGQAPLTPAPMNNPKQQANPMDSIRAQKLRKAREAARSAAAPLNPRNTF